MSGIRKSSIAVLVLSLSCHMLAYWYYLNNLHLFPVPERWHAQIAAVLFVSAALSIPVFFSRAFQWLVLFICLKFFSLLLVGYPLGEYMGIETILIVPLLIETVLSFPFPFCIPAGICEIATIALVQKPHNVWSVEILQANMGDILFFTVNSSVILFLAGLVKYLNGLLLRREYEVGRLDAAVEKITGINLDYQNHVMTVEQEAMEKERNRITREIHDIIGYSLTNQLMIIQAALVYKDAERTRLNELLLRAQSQLNESIEEARGALRKLRNIEIVRERGVALFGKIAKTFEEITRVSVGIDFANIPERFPVEVEKTICRFLQEGMTNSFRHGRATNIWISFWLDEERLFVNLRDDGKGQMKIIEGIGLRGMRERFEALGGGVDANSIPEGFALHAWVPAAVCFVEERP